MNDNMNNNMNMNMNNKSLNKFEDLPLSIEEIKALSAGNYNPANAHQKVMKDFEECISWKELQELGSDQLELAKYAWGEDTYHIFYSADADKTRWVINTDGRWVEISDNSHGWVGELPEQAAINMVTTMMMARRGGFVSTLPKNIDGVPLAAGKTVVQGFTTSLRVSKDGGNTLIVYGPNDLALQNSVPNYEESISQLAYLLNLTVSDKLNEYTNFFEDGDSNKINLVIGEHQKDGYGSLLSRAGGWALSQFGLLSAQTLLLHWVVGEGTDENERNSHKETWLSNYPLPEGVELQDHASKVGADCPEVVLIDCMLKDAVINFYSKLGVEVPRNIYFTDFESYVTVGHHWFDKQELLNYLNVLALTTWGHKNGEEVQYIRLEKVGGTYRLWFENEYYLQIDNILEITDSYRKRYLQNEIVVSNLYQSSTKNGEPIRAHQSCFTYYTAAGVLMKYLMSLLNHVRQGDDSFSAGRAFLKQLSTVAPWCSINETGGTTSGIRMLHERYLAVVRKATRVGFHFDFDPLDGTLTKPSPSFFGEITTPEGVEGNPALDEGMYFACKCIRVHKGSKMNPTSAHFLEFKLTNLKPKQRRKFADALIKKIFGEKASLKQFAKDNFGIKSLRKEDEDDFVSHLVISLYQKVSKLTKRDSQVKGTTGEDIPHPERDTVFSSKTNDWSVGTDAEVDTDRGAVYPSAITFGNSMGPGQHAQLKDGYPYKDPSTESFDFAATIGLDFKEDPENVLQGFPPYAYLIAEDKVVITKENIQGNNHWVIEWDNLVSLPNPKTGEPGWVECKGLNLKKGTQLMKLTYAAGDNNTGYNIVDLKEDLIVTRIEVCYKYNGKICTGMEFKYVGFNPTVHSKDRGRIKSIGIRPVTGEGHIYNQLNNEIPSGISHVFTADSMKAKDFRGNQIECCIETMARTVKGRAMIREINRVLFGTEQDDFLLIDLNYLVAGVYDELYKLFLDTFGRSLWLYNRDKSGLTYTQLERAYENIARECAEKAQALDPSGNTSGKELEKEVTKLLEKEGKESGFWYQLKEDERFLVDAYADIIADHPDARFFINCHPDNYDELETHVCVFFKSTPDKFGCDFVFLERTFALVGNEETHVMMPTKPEISSPRKINSLSKIMMSVTRQVSCGLRRRDGSYIIPPQPEVAKELLQGSEETIEVWSTFEAMAKKMPITYDGHTLPVIPMFLLDDNGENIVNPEIRKLIMQYNSKLVRKARQKEANLIDFAKVFKNVVIDCGEFNLYMPVLVEQEGKKPTRNSMGGRLVQMFEGILCNYNNLTGYVAQFLQRTKGSLTTLLESDNALKLRGTKGLYSKVGGHTAVGINKVYVKYDTQEYWSLVEIACLRGKEEKDIDGMKVIISRMPLSFAGGLTVEVIYADNPFFELMVESQMLINPLTVYRDGGDLDGDDRLIVPIFSNSVVQTDVKEILESLEIRTGKEPLSAGAADTYILDHYLGGKPDNKPLATKQKNIYLDKYSEADRNKQLVELYTAASVVLRRFVSEAHNFSVKAEFASGLTQVLEPNLKAKGEPVPPFLLNPVLTSVTAEVYEGGNLGGLIWDSYDLMTILVKARTQPDSVNELDMGELSELANAAGLNGAEITDILQAAIFAGQCTREKFSVEKTCDITTQDENSFIYFLKCVTAIEMLVSKGKLAPSFDNNNPLKYGKEPTAENLDSHFNMINYVMDWLETNPDLAEKIEDKFPMLRTLINYLRKLLITFVYDATNEYGCGFYEHLLPETVDGYTGPRVAFAQKEYLTEDEAVKEEEVGFIPAELPIPEENLKDLTVKVLQDLISYLPNSRFGVKEGYKGWLLTEGAKLLDTLGEDQLYAVHHFFMKYSNKYMLSGRAGAGKSYVANFISAILQNCTEAKVIELGATGVANQNLANGEGTFNSAFGLGTGDVLPLDLFDQNGKRQSANSLVNRLLNKLDFSINEGRFVVFLIDETFMLSSHLLRVAFDTARLALNKGKINTENEWYNFTFLFVGDPCQLLGADDKKEMSKEGTITMPAWYPSYFVNNPADPKVFKSDSLIRPTGKDSCPKLGLYINKRQGDAAEFADALNQVSEGKDLPQLLWTSVNRNFPDPLKIYLDNLSVQKANKEYLSQLRKDGHKPVNINYGEVRIGNDWWIISEFDRLNKHALLIRTNALPHERSCIMGEEAYNLLSFLPKWVDCCMSLCVGMKFMLRQNDHVNNRWANGSWGYITEINNDHILVDIKGEVVKVETEVLTQKELKDGIAIREYRGILGHPAGALTIHKTQGLTFDEPVQVVIRESHLEYYQAGMLYTAISRVTKPEYLSISVVTKQDSSLTPPEVVNKAITAHPDAVKLRDEAINELINYSHNVLFSKHKDSHNWVTISNVTDEFIYFTAGEEVIAYLKGYNVYKFKSNPSVEVTIEQIENDNKELANALKAYICHQPESKGKVTPIPLDDWKVNQKVVHTLNCSITLDDDSIHIEKDGETKTININTAQYVDGATTYIQTTNKEGVEINYEAIFMLDVSEEERTHLFLGLETWQPFFNYQRPEGYTFVAESRRALEVYINNFLNNHPELLSKLFDDLGTIYIPEWYIIDQDDASETEQGIEINCLSENELACALSLKTGLSTRRGLLDNSLPMSFSDSELGAENSQYVDAFNAYLANKENKKEKGFKQKLMISVLTQKLVQHFGLVKTISSKGGVIWLQKCSYKDQDNSYWSGYGVRSPFIYCLIEAYKSVAKV